MTNSQKLLELLEWSETNPWFDDSFLRSLEEQYQRNILPYFSKKQTEAINNLYNRFIDKD